eukprot:TRINITY_DN1506_c0_g3_i1.p1 TRINITY_DN1506_c0_g3~~TRINITY_DN1506_c0_g3_i1.p1  ORF type:complete len:599 (-),score=143.45 TRINITY_DN1506_c0_g3_i1:226-2022(-)
MKRILREKLHTRSFTAARQWKDPSFQKQFLEDIGRNKLRVQKLDDWYSVTADDIKRYGGKGLLKEHGHSVRTVITSAIPRGDEPWDLDRFHDMPRGHWLNVANQVAFLQKFAKKFNIAGVEDWYQVRAADLARYGGASLLHRYKNSLSLALRSIFPDLPWKIWKFDHVPEAFWQSKQNRREFLESLASELGYNNWEDWYGVEAKDIHAAGGSGLLRQYNNSVNKIIMENFPEHQWLRWKFNRVESGFWFDKNNQLEFVEHLGRELNIKSKEDWYFVTNEDVFEHGGAGILNHFNNSRVSMLTTLIPNHEWDLDRFNKKEDGLWKDKTFQAMIVDRIRKRLKINAPNDWHDITAKEFSKAGGAALLQLYNQSLYEVLKEIYPSATWDRERFEKKKEGGYWKDPQNAREFLERVAKNLGVKTMEDWYGVKAADIARFGGGTLVQYHRNSMLKLLQAVYPEYPWKNNAENKWGSVSSKSQQQLFRRLAGIFPGEDLFLNYVIEPTPANRLTQKIEVDVAIPALLLAFEYHGKQHYVDIPIYTELQQRRTMDSMKRKACAQAGFSLVEIPFWWDGAARSLVAEITSYRPDLEPRLTEVITEK